MKVLHSEGEPRLLLESAALGVAGALSARLFMWMLTLCGRLFLNRLAGYQAPSIEPGGTLVQHIGPHGLWLIPLATTLGGLLCGFLVYRFAPEAEGHGTDTAVNAFHRQNGIIRPRVAPLKMIASAITIGSGGSAGREGPIALITAAIGSFYASLTHRTDQQRRLLLLAGMAGGLSAIFRSPMGTGVFAIEVLYSNMEFEVDALLYTMCSSAVAYAVNGFFVGFEPLFHIPTVPTPLLRDYATYAILGVAAGLVGTLLPETFYRTRDLFRSLPIPVWARPALGGLAVGILALKLPQVLQGGYGWIQLAIDGRLALHLLLILVFAKIIALALTVASGGSGGVFAPSLFVGAMLGGAFAIFLHQPAAVFVVVGMAAVFGSAARVPIATMLMVTEMAGGFHLLVPAGAAVMIAYLLQSRLASKLRYPSLYEGQVPTRSQSPAHYLEQIQIALSLIGRRNILLSGQVGHLDLMRLLRSHVSLTLAGDKEISMAFVPDNSPVAGQAIADLYRRLDGYEFEVIAVLRREHIILPHADTILQPKDRVALITSPPARQPLAKYLAPLPEQQNQIVDPPAAHSPA